MSSFSINLINEEGASFINKDAKLEILDSSGKFTEGPVWHPEGYYLFSDITLNTIFRYSEQRGKETFISNSGTINTEDENLKADMAGSNGLAWGKNKELLVCRHGSHEVARYKDGKLEGLVNKNDGRLLNSPNDIVVDKKGRIWFSDPPYGLKDGKLNPEKFQSKAWVYCFAGEDLIPFCDRYNYPNGLCLSPDEKELFIVSNKPAEDFISVYDTETMQLIKTIEGYNSDGLKSDSRGNLYGASKEGIIVLSREGEKLAMVSLPAIPANLCFGGVQGKDLFITAREYIFLIPSFIR